MQKIIAKFALLSVLAAGMATAASAQDAKCCKPGTTCCQPGGKCCK